MIQHVYQRVAINSITYFGMTMSEFASSLFSSDPSTFASLEPRAVLQLVVGPFPFFGTRNKKRNASVKKVVQRWVDKALA